MKLREHLRRRTIVSTGALGLMIALAGCSGSITAGGAAPAPADASSPTPSVVSESTDALESLVLDKSEITMGWRAFEDDDRANDDHSYDTLPDGCVKAIVAGTDTLRGASRRWVHPAPGTVLDTAVYADPDAQQHVEAATDALRGCPATTPMTNGGQSATFTYALKDLGQFGDARFCVDTKSVQADTTAIGKECVVAVGTHIVVVYAITTSPDKTQEPDDSEVIMIVKAAVAKVSTAD